MKDFTDKLKTEIDRVSKIGKFHKSRNNKSGLISASFIFRSISISKEILKSGDELRMEKCIQSLSEYISIKDFKRQFPFS